MNHWVKVEHEPFMEVLCQTAEEKGWKSWEWDNDDKFFLLRTSSGEFSVEKHGPKVDRSGWTNLGMEQMMNQIMRGPEAFNDPDKIKLSLTEHTAFAVVRDNVVYINGTRITNEELVRIHKRSLERRLI